MAWELKNYIVLRTMYKDHFENIKTKKKTKKEHKQDLSKNILTYHFMPKK